MHYKLGQQRIAKIIATLSPDEYIKTNTIATEVNISLFSARHYLRELLAQGVVEQDCTGRGKTIRWRLASQHGPGTEPEG